MKYYVNKNKQTDSDDYEVHKDGCQYLAVAINVEYLGDFTHCADAVAKAKRLGYKTADGCAYCSPACHTS